MYRGNLVTVVIKMHHFYQLPSICSIGPNKNKVQLNYWQLGALIFFAALHRVRGCKCSIQWHENSAHIFVSNDKYCKSEKITQRQKHNWLMIIQYQIFCDAKAKKGHDMFSVPSVSVKLRKHTPSPLSRNYFFLFIFNVKKSLIDTALIALHVLD